MGPIRGIGLIRGRLPLAEVVHRVRGTTAEGQGLRVDSPPPLVRMEDPKVRRVKGRAGEVTRTPGLRAQSLINEEQPGARQRRRVADPVAPQTVGDAADQMTVEMATVMVVMTQSRMMEIRNASRR